MTSAKTSRSLAAAAGVGNVMWYFSRSGRRRARSGLRNHAAWKYRIRKKEEDRAQESFLWRLVSLPALSAVVARPEQGRSQRDTLERGTFFLLFVSLPSRGLYYALLLSPWPLAWKRSSLAFERIFNNVATIISSCCFSSPLSLFWFQAAGVCVNVLLKRHNTRKTAIASNLARQVGHVMTSPLLSGFAGHSPLKFIASVSAASDLMPSSLHAPISQLPCASSHAGRAVVVPPRSLTFSWWL
jgi:hypothetical protein